MKTISIGKFRGLQRCSSSRGTFTCLALDHRQNLRKANPSFSDNERLCEFKIEVVRNLAPLGTAVLLDPEVSVGQSISEQVLPGDRGLVVALEGTGYTGESTARKVSIIPGWSVEKAKRMGADMVKLLVYYHPESETTQEIEDVVKQVAEECLIHDISLMIEPLSYTIISEKLSSAEKKYVVVETARHLSKISGVDVLKTEFPLDTNDLNLERMRSACRELNQAADVPWIVLSAAVGFETYLQQVDIACQEGASGTAVGRAVWKEAILMTDAERKRFLETTGRERLARVNALCFAAGRPFTEHYRAEAPFDWYMNY
jgi:tagatose 1,6-diphosphate aldolase